MEESMAEKQREIEEQEKRAQENLRRIKNKLLVLSGKGGVGKSTIAVNLAWALAQRGNQVGLLDIDIHGPNVPKMLGLEGVKLVSREKGIEPAKAGGNLKVISIAFLLESIDTAVIWRGPLKMTVIRQFLADVNWGALDYLIVDAPPGTGDEPLSICQLIKDVTGAILVTTPQEVSLLDVRKSINFVKQLNVPPTGIVENMSGFICPHCGKSTNIFKTGGGRRIAHTLAIPFLGCVPLEPGIVEASDAGNPFLSLDVETESRKKFIEIVDKVIEITNSYRKSQV